MSTILSSKLGFNKELLRLSSTLNRLMLGEFTISQHHAVVRRDKDSDHKVAVAADIKTAFLMIAMMEKDRDVL